MSRVCFIHITKKITISNLQQHVDDDGLFTEKIFLLICINLICSSYSMTDTGLLCASDISTRTIAVPRIGTRGPWLH